MILIRKHNRIVILQIDSKQAKSIKNKSLIKNVGKSGAMWGKMCILEPEFIYK